MRLGPDGPIEEGKIVPRRSPGLVLMRGESCSRGHGFKSQHRILDGNLSHLLLKFYCMLEERGN